MRELNVSEIKVINGGIALGAAGLLWGILMGASSGLNSFGRGIGSGLYDSIHG